jgi:ABC-type transport system substrate-binding protein
MHGKLINARLLIFAPLLLLLVLAAACGADATPAPQVIEKEVVKEIEIQVTKEVVKEVEVEVEVIKEVIKEVDKEVVKEVEVVTEVEKEVIKEVEVEKEVVVTVVATPTPAFKIVDPKVSDLQIMLDPVAFDTNLTWMGHPSEMNNQTRHMGDSLIDMNPFTGLMVPGLALEWEMTSPDALTWLVKLRPGIPFHDGWGEFTAKDLVHSYSLIVSEESPASVSRRWRQRLGTTQNTTMDSNDIISEVPKAIKIIDDHTVEFNLIKPEKDLPAELSANSGFTFMMSENFWKSEGRQGYTDKFVGTGSWKFNKRVTDQYLRMDRDETNWQKVPEFKSLQLNWSREPSTRLAALLTEEVAMATLPRSLYTQAKTEGMVIFSSTIPANGVVIGFGGLYLETSPHFVPDIPFLNKNVRKAINHALDRNEINNEIFGGAGEPMYNQGFHWSQIAWNPEWEENFERDYGYDPDKAKKLIADAGYAPGEIKIKSLITELAQLPEMAELGEVMSIYLEPVGIQVEEVEMEFSKFVSEFRGGTMQNLLSNLPRTVTQPDGAIRTFNLALPNGSVAYSETALIQDLYPKFKASMDDDERVRLLLEMGNHKYNEYVEVPMFWLLGEILGNPAIVKDHHFSGGIAGTFTHWEFTEAVPK